jgi:hypothetical protein
VRARGQQVLAQDLALAVADLDPSSAAIGNPVGLNRLVTIVADFHGIKDRRPVAKNEDVSAPPASLDGTWLTSSKTIERRMYMASLWREIVELPPRQGATLLLNLREPGGRDAIALFPLMGVASIPQIATVVGMSADELARIWNDLPLEDSVLAARLQATWQQVINLRKSARGDWPAA